MRPNISFSTTTSLSFPHPSCPTWVEKGAHPNVIISQIYLVSRQHTELKSNTCRSPAKKWDVSMIGRKICFNIRIMWKIWSIAGGWLLELHSARVQSGPFPFLDYNPDLGKPSTRPRKNGLVFGPWVSVLDRSIITLRNSDLCSKWGPNYKLSTVGLPPIPRWTKAFPYGYGTELHGARHGLG